MKPNRVDFTYKNNINCKNNNNGIINADEDDDDSSEDEDYVYSNKSDNDCSSSSSNSSSSSDDSEFTDEYETENESNKSQIKNEKKSTNGGNHQQNGNSCKNNSLKIKNDKNFCCVCLNEENESSDELVECDSCGFLTHESCYGITDTDSKISSDSLASTEPWFCNSCLADKKSSIKLGTNKPAISRNCELCPNSNCGLMKETESGQFIHTVCALYSQDVSFEDTDSLWPVIINETASKKWCEKVCSLCEDMNYSRTGICIKCDAGLCKSYFHATCALKHGLTVDPAQQNAFDSYFAYCKQHNDSTVIKQRKQNYAIMISNFNSNSINSNENRERIKLKFINAQINYQLKRESAQIPRTDLKKQARMLTSCPSALKALIQKSSHISESKEINNQSLNVQQKHHANAVTFTPEFVKYFHERENKIEQYKRDLPELKKSQADLKNQESVLLNDYESKMNEHKKLVKTFEKESKLLATCINLVEKTVAKSKLPSFDQLFININSEKQEESSHSIVVDIDEDSNNLMNISSINSTTSRRSSTTNVTQLNSSKSIRTYTKRKSSFCANIISLDAECTICKQKSNSHLLVECDTCKKIYHINCLEPPLSAVPKKSKLYGWECAKCVRKKDSDYEGDEDEKITTDQNNDEDELTPTKRLLRRERKQARSGIQEQMEMEHLIKLAKQNSKKKEKKLNKKNKNKQNTNNMEQKSINKREHSPKSSSENDQKCKKKLKKEIEPTKKKNYYIKKKFRPTTSHTNTTTEINNDTQNSTTADDFDMIIDAVINKSAKKIKKSKSLISVGSESETNKHKLSCLSISPCSSMQNGRQNITESNQTKKFKSSKQVN